MRRLSLMLCIYAIVIGPLTASAATDSGWKSWENITAPSRFPRRGFCISPPMKA